MEGAETGGCWPDTRMVRSSLVLGMQRYISAIKDCFPEGVWLNALFQFLLKWGYLTVVFQDRDGFRSTEVQMSGIRSSVTITGAYW